MSTAQQIVTLVITITIVTAISLFRIVRHVYKQAYSNGYATGWQDRAAEDPTSSDSKPIISPTSLDLQTVVVRIMSRIPPTKRNAARDAIWAAASAILNRAEPSELRK